MALVERDQQLSILRGLLSESSAGDGRVAVISGPICCGKTELVHKFVVEAAAMGARVLTATAARAEQALPFGVVGQLIRGTTFAAETVAQLTGLISEAAATGVTGPAGGAVALPVPHQILMALQGLTEQASGPLVIAVEDLHYADLPSLHCLAYLVRRLRSAPLMLLVSESSRPLPAHNVFHADLPTEPWCRRIQVGPLSQPAVVEILAEWMDPAAAARLGSGYHAISGGNPLILRGLIEDLGAVEPSAPVVGPATEQALLSVLHRCEPSVLWAAWGLAVLDQPTNERQLGRLLGLPHEAAGKAVAVLDAAGILDADRFRHPQFRTAVLGAVPQADRTVLHSSAARLLHEDGAPATAVAEHLITAEVAESACAVTVLHEAAEQSLADGDFAATLRYLRTALRARATAAQQAETVVLLSRAEWRVDPARALRHVPQLAEAVRAGHLDDGRAVVPAAWLLWFGHWESALDILDQVDREFPLPNGQPLAGGRAIRFWLSLAYPSLRQATRLALPDDERAQLVPATTNPSLRAGLLLHRVLTRGPDPQTGATAEQLLRECRLAEDTLAPIIAAIIALIVSDRFTAAESWCAQLAAEDASHHAPTWHGVFSALAAEAALRRGDLTGAGNHARTALTVTSPRNWGVGIGIPLSVLVAACTEAGRNEEALDHLQVAVPEAMFQTPIGLLYLRSRGRYHRAYGHLRSAVEDFMAIGQLMRDWHMDRPELVPWRTELAETYLRLGRPKQARQLAAEQLERLGSGETRARAVTLRVLAAASEPVARLALLNQSLEALRPDEDALETAYTLADLGRRYQDVGRLEQARIMTRRALHIAGECGAETLVRQLVTVLPENEPPTPPNPGFGSSRVHELSDAERRVAVLAARGYTNRQIASTLYVTISTVEQHLTKVYRKLKVSRRTDLLFEIDHQLEAPLHETRVRTS